jgi:hypothetical protein
VVGSCECRNEISGSMTGEREFIEQLSDYQLAQKDCALSASSHCCQQQTFARRFTLISHHREATDRPRWPIALP